MSTRRVVLKISTKTIRPATTWNVALAALVRIEHAVKAEDMKAIEARWSFGRELLQHRIEYRGRQVLPADLMTLTLQKCGLTKREVMYRVKFADKYPAKQLMRDTVSHYPSWHRITHEALIEKPPQTSRRTKAITPTPGRVLRSLNSALDVAFGHSGELTREYVKELEQLGRKVQELLAQIDRNDAARAS